jgi:DNA-binding MarR family transcriptional regulator
MNQSEHASLPSRLRFSLKQLEVFVAIAQGGSARSAAQRVARSQSAASAALAELEHTLAVELFDRIGRRLVLNENGRALLPGALALLNHAAELESLFTEEHAAPLRLAASLTIGEYLLPNQTVIDSVESEFEHSNRGRALSENSLSPCDARRFEFGVWDNSVHCSHVVCPLCVIFSGEEEHFASKLLTHLARKVRTSIPCVERSDRRIRLFEPCVFAAGDGQIADNV